MHLTQARDWKHCERSASVDTTTDPNAVTCTRCITVIEFYRDSLKCCVKYGFNQLDDVTKRNMIKLLPQARIVANEAELQLLNAVEMIVKGGM